MTVPIFLDANLAETPFSHVRIPYVLPLDCADSTLHWLSEKAPWRLRVEHFYEQNEFSLLTANLSEEIECLVQPSFVESVRESVRNWFKLGAMPDIVDINAHRLTPGQTIRIHNDFIEGGETHRLLIQLNGGWKVENGGLLMLFNSSAPEDVRSVILPRHRSGFAFEISPRSFHAVSQIKCGERYTLVYSLRAPADDDKDRCGS
jgi:Rps23 Pro-64 3,4-dihydroxylase Tpa1-like proline 4-hydroxylase